MAQAACATAAFASALPVRVAIIARPGTTTRLVVVRTWVRAAATARPPSIAQRLQRAEELLAATRAQSQPHVQPQPPLPPPQQRVVDDSIPPPRRNSSETFPSSTRNSDQTRNAASPVPGHSPHRKLPSAVAAAERRTELSAARASKSADPGPRYDANLAVEMFKNRVWHVRKRQLQIVLPLVSFVSRVVLDVQTGNENKNRQKRAEEFLGLISSLGPAFIKAGQALSSRPDLLPAEYLNELQKLQDRLAPFPNDIAFKLIEEELGSPVDDIFESIDPVPVAAASIGQVYCARLRGTGEKVAVKVQRPDCEKIISLDIYILRNVSGTIHRLFKLIGRDVELQSIIEEFGKLIYEEIDYLSEARNAERFLELYGDLPNVNAPRIYWRFTKRRVLTMQWMEGVRLTSPELKGKNSELVQAMVQCSLRQMLENGYFHADTHLGNLLAHQGALTYLDFGMMSMVEPKQRYGIIEAVVHMVNRDFDALTDLYVRLGFLPSDIDRKPIAAALALALPDVLGASVGELNFKSVIDKLGSVMYKYPFRLPPYYTAVIRCLGVLEGVAIQIDPSFKILNEAYPYIASRLLTDPAPELQQALQALLFDPEGHPRWSRLESLLESAANTEDYDVSLAVEQLVSFLLSPKGKVIRYTLADDLTNELDLLGVDLTRYYVGMAVKASEAVGLRIPSSLTNVQVSEPTASMKNLEKLTNILARSKGFNPNNLTPVIRKILREPEGQRIGLEVAVSLAEKFTSRAIRFAFGLQSAEVPSTTSTRPREGRVV